MPPAGGEWGRVDATHDAPDGPDSGDRRGSAWSFVRHPAPAATILVKPGKLDHFVLTAPPRHSLARVSSCASNPTSQRQPHHRVPRQGGRLCGERFRRGRGRSGQTAVRGVRGRGHGQGRQQARGNPRNHGDRGRGEHAPCQRAGPHPPQPARPLRGQCAARGDRRGGLPGPGHRSGRLRQHQGRPRGRPRGSAAGDSGDGFGGGCRQDYAGLPRRGGDVHLPAAQGRIDPRRRPGGADAQRGRKCGDQGQSPRRSTISPCSAPRRR